MRSSALSTLAGLLLIAVFVSVCSGENDPPSIPIAWQDTPQTLKSPAALKPTGSFINVRDGGPAGKLWVFQTEDGLRVRAHIPARFKSGTSLYIRLTAADEPVFPPIGWANQFGDRVLTSSAACADLAAGETKQQQDQQLQECESWYTAQVAYRELFPKLFQRNWRIHADSATEVDAEPARLRLPGEMQGRAKLLTSGALPTAKVRSEDGSLIYDVLVAWEAMPPIPSSELKQLRLSGEIRVKNAPAEDEKPIARWPAASNGGAWAYLTLPRPPSYSITTCALDVAGAVMDLDETGSRSLMEYKSIYFRPQKGPIVYRLVALANTASGYKQIPDSLSYSPNIYPVTAFEKPSEDLTIICGPWLAVKKGETVLRSGYILGAVGDVEVRRMPGGELLIRDGPRKWRSYFSKEGCTACQRVSLSVYRYWNGEITRIFEENGVSKDEIGANAIEMTANWSKIGVHDQNIYTIHCWQPATHKYGDCGNGG